MEEQDIEKLLSSLPPAVRRAIEDHDTDAFQSAMDELPAEQGREVVAQLRAAGIIGEGPIEVRDFQEVLQEFDVLFQAIIAVAQGDQSQRPQVETVLPDLERAGYHLSQAVALLWSGERNLTALTAGLDPASAQLVEHLLRRIEGKATDRSPIDLEAIAASLPPDVLAAIEAQDDAAFEQAIGKLSPADREFVSHQLELLQSHTSDQESDLQALLESLPDDVRQAILDQNHQALRTALQNLPPSEAENILQELQDAGILAEPSGEDLVRSVDEFKPIVEAILAVARGDDKPRLLVEDFLAHLDAQGWEITSSVQRIWAGERDYGSLTAGLGAQETEIIQQILHELG